MIRQVLEDLAALGSVIMFVTAILVWADFIGGIVSW